jgi:hypothetical protein
VLLYTLLQGNDNDPDGGVFNCSHVHCGGYYHMSCIESTPGTQVKTQTTFLCPRHLCATCEVGVSCSTKSKAAAAAGSSSSGKRLGKAAAAKAAAAAAAAAASSIVRTKYRATSGVYATLHRCMLCPVAYHGRCIPPTARHNEKAVLCPRHPDAQLPLLEGESAADGGATVSGAAAQWRSSKEIFVVPPKRGRSKGSSMPTLVMPGSMPDPDSDKDHHFRLPLSVMEDYE